MRFAKLFLTMVLVPATHLAPASAIAAETKAAVLSLELNGAQASQKGCRLTFIVTNDLGADLSKAAFEIALFDEAGVVDKLTVLEFGDLPAGKTKVTRFDLAGTDCGKISRVLVNGAGECVGAGVEPGACMRDLKTETKTSITFGV